MVREEGDGWGVTEAVGEREGGQGGRGYYIGLGE